MLQKPGKLQKYSETCSVITL